MPERFIIIKDGGLERLALPRAKRSILQCAVNIHREGVTPKSRLAHNLLRLNAWLGTLLWMPGARSGVPERLNGFELSGWLDHVAGRLGQKKLYASIAFPPKIAENRFVAFLVSTAGQSVGFAKVSRDDFTDHQIRTEIAGLEKMAAFRATSFSIPAVLDSGIYDGHQYAVLESIIASARSGVTDMNLRLEQMLRELAASFSINQPTDCSWWPGLETAGVLVQPLVELVRQRQNQPIQVCLSHGDFGVGNTLQRRDIAFLYDWEEFCGDAPRFTDWFFFLLPPAQIKSYGLVEVAGAYDVAFERIRLFYPEVTHWDLGLALLLLSTRRNWVASPETTRILAEVIYQRCLRDDHKNRVS
ncbi:MAG: hypothetical protein JXB38_20815 [Anaerolineales bacterium]|nr:hypothetical protein [Anaerolineales bacterium]